MVSINTCTVFCLQLWVPNCMHWFMSYLSIRRFWYLWGALEPISLGMPRDNLSFGRLGSYTWIFAMWGSVPLTPVLLKRQLYSNFLPSASVELPCFIGDFVYNHSLNLSFGKPLHLRGHIPLLFPQEMKPCQDFSLWSYVHSNALLFNSTVASAMLF